MERIFIVDDDSANCYFYEKFLIFYGFEVAGIAEDGEEAVIMFKNFSDKPKVILMDNRMPNKTGIEASLEILTIDKTVKIIFISADSSIKEEALSIGAYSFLDKPFSIVDMIDEINTALACYTPSIPK